MLEQIRVGMAALDQNLKYNGAFGGGACFFAETSIPDDLRLAIIRLLKI
jgi:hypothetical protein